MEREDRMKFFQDLAPEVQQAIVSAIKKRFRNDVGLKGAALDEAVDNYINCNNTHDNVKAWVNKYSL
jgi:hypothetical protein